MIGSAMGRLSTTPNDLRSMIDIRGHVENALRSTIGHHADSWDEAVKAVCHSCNLSVHIADALNKFLLEFKANPPPHAVRRQVLAKFIHHVVKEHEAWSPKEQTDGIAAVEQTVKHLLHNELHDLLLVEPSVVELDESLTKRCDELRPRLTTSHLGMSDNIKQYAPWEDAQRCLVEMESEKTPKGKIGKLVVAFSHMQEAGDETQMNADELLPVVVFVVVQANLTSLHQQLTYIMDFGKYGLASMTSYFVTSLVMAVSFIHKINEAMLAKGTATAVGGSSRVNSNRYSVTPLLQHMDNHDLPQQPQATTMLALSDTDAWWSHHLSSHTHQDQEGVVMPELEHRLVKKHRWRVWLTCERHCVLLPGRIEYFDSPQGFANKDPPIGTILLRHSYIKVYPETETTPSQLVIHVPDRGYRFQGPSAVVAQWAHHASEHSAMRTILLESTTEDDQQGPDGANQTHDNHECGRSSDECSDSPVDDEEGLTKLHPTFADALRQANQSLD